MLVTTTRSVVVSDQASVLPRLVERLLGELIVRMVHSIEDLRDRLRGGAATRIVAARIASRDR